jgi:hypothetical protein
MHMGKHQTSLVSQYVVHNTYGEQSCPSAIVFHMFQAYTMTNLSRSGRDANLQLQDKRDDRRLILQQHDEFVEHHRSKFHIVNQDPHR